MEHERLTAGDPRDNGLFQAARSDPGFVLLEGLHPYKHAFRFGATIHRAVTNDRARLTTLAEQLAPDVSLDDVVDVSDEAWQGIASRDPTSPLLAVAERRTWGLADIGPSGHVVILDRPRHAGNVGAVIRAAAAADAGGVVTIGGIDPWTPGAVRGAAGLQFALPVVRLDDGSALPDLGRPNVAVDPAGRRLDTGDSPPTSWVLGTERHGLDGQLRGACDDAVRLPMRPGVSSLNLAVAAGIVLYSRPVSGRGEAV